MVQNETAGDINIYVKEYSSAIIAYVVNVYGKYHYFLNNKYDAETTVTALHRLKVLVAQNAKSGFIMIQGNGEPYISKQYVYSKKVKGMVYKAPMDKGSNVYELHAFRNIQLRKEWGL